MPLGSNLSKTNDDNDDGDEDKKINRTDEAERNLFGATAAPGRFHLLILHILQVLTPSITIPINYCIKVWTTGIGS